MLARASLAAIACLTLIGCSQKAPKGINASALDNVIAGAIGDPSTCVKVVEKASGKVVYQYGSHMTCGLALSNCGGQGTTTGDALGKEAATGAAKTASCPSPAGGTAYAMGPLPNSKPQYAGLAYSASMNTKHLLPGIEIQRRLELAFRQAGF
jgi:hypothetical protein